MCLQFGGLMEDAFTSPDLCEMSRVLLNLYVEITLGVSAITEAQIPLPGALM